MEILIFTLDGRKYALDLKHVERSLLAAEYSPIPNCSKHVLGAINIHGEIVPVVNMRELLQLESKEMTATDNFILCKVREERMALLVDRVDLVKLCDHIPSNSHAVQCILKEEEEMTLFCDLEKLIKENSLSVG